MYVYSGDPFPIHLFLYGPEGCGKSFIPETLRDMLIEMSSLSIHKETEASMSTGMNMDDFIMLQDEIRPDDWRGKDGKSGNMQASIKSRMSLGRMENLFLYLPPDGPRQLKFTRSPCKTAMVIAMNIDPLREIERPIQARAAIKKMLLGRVDDEKIIESNATSHRGSEHAVYRADVKEDVQHWQMLAYLIFKLIYCGFLDQINVDVASDLMLKILKRASRNGVRTARNIRNAHRLVCMMKSIVVYRVIQERFRYYPLFKETEAFVIKDLLQLGPFLVATEADMHLSMHLLRFQFSDPDADEIRDVLVRSFFDKSHAICPTCSVAVNPDCRDHRPTSKYVVRRSRDEVDHDYFYVQFFNDAKVEYKHKTKEKSIEQTTMEALLKKYGPDLSTATIEAGVARLLDATVKCVKPGDGELFAGDETIQSCLSFCQEGFKVSKAWVWGSSLESAYETAIAGEMTYAGQNRDSIFLATGMRPESDFSTESFSVWNYRRYEPSADVQVVIKNSFKLTASQLYKIKQHAGKNARFNVNRIAQPVSEWKISGNVTIHAINEHVKRQGVSPAELVKFKESSPLYPDDERAWRDRYFASQSDKHWFKSDELESVMAKWTEDEKKLDEFRQSKCIVTRPPDEVQQKAALAAAAAASAVSKAHKAFPVSAEALGLPESPFEPFGGRYRDLSSPRASASASASDVQPMDVSPSSSASASSMSYDVPARSSAYFEHVIANMKAEEERMRRKRKETDGMTSAAASKKPNTKEGGAVDSKHSAGSSRENSMPGDVKTPSPPRLARQSTDSLPAPVPASQRFPKASRPPLANLAALLNNPNVNVGTHTDVEAARLDMAYKKKLADLHREKEEATRRVRMDIDSEQSVDSVPQGNANMDTAKMVE